MNQREIFPFRVSDDNVVLRHEERIGDFPLCREGFAGTGCAENQAVGILQLFAVHHDDVVGQSIQAIVERFTAHKQFLGGERHKDGRGRGGQRPPDRDVVEPKRQAAHQAIFLHIVQPAQRAVIFLRNTCHLEHRIVQFLPGLGRIQKQHRDQEHPLIAGLKIIQQFLGITAIGSQVGRNNFHIIPGADSFLLLLDLHAVDVGHFALNQFDRLQLIQGLNVHGDNQVFVNIQKLGQHFVGQFRGQNLKIGYRAIGIAHHKVLAGFEHETRRRDIVLRPQAGFQYLVVGEGKRRFGFRVQRLIQDFQPFHPIQGIGGHAQDLEVVQNIRLDALQLRPCHCQIVSLNGKGNVLGLEKPIVSLRQLVVQHLRVFHANIIKSVILRFDLDDLLILPHAAFLVDKGQLEMDAAVKVIEKIAPVFKDGALIVILGQLIVDVVKADGLGIDMVGHSADTVLAHFLIGNGILDGNPLCLAFQRKPNAFFICLYRFNGAGLFLFYHGAALLSFAAFSPLSNTDKPPPHTDWPSHTGEWPGAGTEPGESSEESSPCASRPSRTWQREIPAA